MNVDSSRMQDISHILDSIGDGALAKTVSGFLSAFDIFDILQFPPFSNALLDEFSTS